MLNYYSQVERALNNEIYLDMDYISRYPREVKGLMIYRPMRNNINISVLFSFLTLFSSFLYFTSSLIRSLFVKKKKACITSHELWLSFSQRSNDIFDCLNVNRDELINLRPGRECVKYLGAGSLFKSYSISIVLIIFMWFKLKPRYSINLHHIFELVNFIFFMKIIKKIGINKINICNHYDRWATLLSHSGLFDVEIYQHGLLPQSVKIRYNLINIKKVNCYSEDDIGKFRNFINSSCIFELYNVALNIDSSNVTNVLIVSEPSKAVEDVELLMFLIKNGVENVMLRPHPISKHDRCFREVERKYMSLDNKIPNPKIILSRESTLGMEYQLEGYLVIWLDNDMHNVDILNDIRPHFV